MAAAGREPTPVGAVVLGEEGQGQAEAADKEDGLTFHDSSG